MKNTILFIYIIILLSGIQLTFAQPQITNFSDKNDVYSMHFATDTMWIGSTGGVVYRVFSNFSIPHIITMDNGLSSNYITAIVVDNNGTKWFGSFDRGISAYNAGSWSYYNSITGVINNLIYCLAVDASGNIWAGTPTGAYRFDGTNWTQFNDNTTVLGEVRSISVDGANIWFGTFGNGLYSFDGTNWSNLTTADGISSNIITAVAARNDSLFVGNNLGISFYNPTGTNWTSSTVGNNDVLDIVFNSFGTIYAGTSNGMFRYSAGSWNVDNPFGLSKIGVLEIQGNSLWAGFNELGYGVQSSDGTTPMPYPVTSPGDPGKNDVSDIISHNSLVYVATYGNGISRYDGNNWTIFNVDIPDNYISSLAMQADTLWMGTNTGAVSYDGLTWSQYTVIDPIVNAVAVDRKDINKMWCGTASGVSSLLNGVPTNYTTNEGLYNNEVMAITVDTSKIVWFLHKNGLSMYDGTNFSVLSLADLGISGAVLFDIDADEAGGVWIASSVGVIEYTYSGTINHFTTADGLADNNVLSVYVDGNNIKHFGTKTRGISLLSNVGWQNITRQNGIPTNKITAVYFHNVGNYIWTGGDWGGISQIYIPPLSVSANISSAEICNGDAVRIAANVTGGFGPGNYFYSWTSTGTTYSSIKQIDTIQPQTNTTYYLTADDDFNSGTFNISVVVNVVDTSLISGPDTLCYDGKNINYSIVNDTNKSYSWSITGGQIVSNQSLPQIDVSWDANVTNRSLTLTETKTSNNCSVTQQFDVNVNVVDTSKITGAGMVCYDGKNINYSITNDANKSYSWSITGGQIVSNQSLPQIDVSWATDVTSWSLALTETNTSSNCSVTQQFDVNVNVVDTSKITGPDTVCSNGKNANYSIINDTNKSYSWSITGGQIVSDQSQSQIEVNWAKDITNGNLILTETDVGSNCSVIQQFDVNIDIIANANIVEKGTNLLICTDSGMVFYQWYLDDTMIPGGERQFYYMENQQGSINGIYHVEIETSKRCKIISNSIEIKRTSLKVYPLPTKNILNIDFVNDIIANGKTHITDLYGKRIEIVPFSKEAEFKHLELNISHYKPGIYYYIIYLDAQHLKSGKFIID